MDIKIKFENINGLEQQLRQIYNKEFIPRDKVKSILWSIERSLKANISSVDIGSWCDHEVVIKENNEVRHEYIVFKVIDKPKHINEESYEYIGKFTITF